MKVDHDEEKVDGSVMQYNPLPCHEEHDYGDCLGVSRGPHPPGEGTRANDGDHEGGQTTHLQLSRKRWPCALPPWYCDWRRAHDKGGDALHLNHERTDGFSDLECGLFRRSRTG